MRKCGSLREAKSTPDEMPHEAIRNAPSLADKCRIELGQGKKETAPRASVQPRDSALWPRWDSSLPFLSPAKDAAEKPFPCA